MNNVIYIKGEITDESVEAFITDYNRCKTSEPVTIYINSIGGDIAHATVITDVINSNKANITLIATGGIVTGKQIGRAHV